MSVLALIAGAPIHPTIRLEPHGLLFLFFFFSSILDRHTEKLSNFRSSTQEARVWSRAIPIYFALGTKWRVSAVSPTIPWPSTGHATYIYIYIYTTGRYDPRQLFREFTTTYRWCCRKVSATWWFCRTGWIDSPDLVASCSSANRSRTSLRLWSPRCSVSRTIPV